MPKPWEKYGSPEQKPWEKRKQTEAPQPEKFGPGTSTITGQPIDEQVPSTAPPTMRATPDNDGFIKRSATDIGQRLQNIAAEPLNFQSVATLRQPLHVAGQLAGGVNDILGEALVSGFRALPEGAREGITGAVRSAGETRPGQAVRRAAGFVGEKYGQLSEAYPEEVKDIEATANILTAGLAAKGLRPVAKEGKAIASDLTSMVTTKTQGSRDRAIKRIVKTGINKGVKPTVAGKYTYTQGSKYLDSADEAVRAITRNKGSLQLADDAGNIVSGELPKSLNQFSQAIEQTKRQVFQQYNDLEP